MSKSNNRELLAAIKRVKCLIIVCNQVPAFGGIGGEVKEMPVFFLGESRHKIKATVCANNKASHCLYRCMPKEFSTLHRVPRKGIHNELLLVPFLNAHSSLCLRFSNLFKDFIFCS